jgi:CPA2 family monovalent cation:H+ antiporter-2
VSGTGTDRGTEGAAEPTRLSGHVVLVGFGRVGAIVGEMLKAKGTPFLVVEDADIRVASTRAMGIEAIAGNAADPSVLALANLRGASNLVIAIPDAFEAGRIAESAREANPAIQIVARAHSEAEVEHLTKLGANSVIMGEREIAIAMMDWMQSAAPRPA